MSLKHYNAFKHRHHAFLFCGPRGVGKTTAARLLGFSIDNMVEGNTIDYHELDGASHRGIDAVRFMYDHDINRPCGEKKSM